MRRPTFLLLGAAKAGTSSLYRYLQQHPELFVPTPKEPNFFALGGRPANFRGPGDDVTINQYSIHDPESYRRLFKPGRKAKASGEASTLYLYDESAPQAIRNALPDAKLIVMLRDPVERAFSSYLHLIRDGRETAATFAEALAAEPDRRRAGWEHLWHYREVGRYARQLERYYRLFDRRQMRVYLFEEYIADPARTLASVFDFLGVASEFEVETDRRYNVSGLPRSQRLQGLLKGSPTVRRLARALVPRPVRNAIWAEVNRWNTRPGKPSIGRADRDSLLATYRAEQSALESLLGRPIEGWFERSF